MCCSYQVVLLAESQDRILAMHAPPADGGAFSTPGADTAGQGLSWTTDDVPDRAGVRASCRQGAQLN